MRPRGSFQLATLRGVPIYVHFSLPMVGAVLSFMYLRGKGAYYEGRLQQLEAAKKRVEAEDDYAPPPRDQLH